MKIVIAPDKFKGSLSAQAAAEAMARGVRDAIAAAEIDLCPLADGGEGTVAALVAATGGQLIRRRVTGPLPDMKVEATFGILGNGIKGERRPSALRLGLEEKAKGERETVEEKDAGNDSSLSPLLPLPTAVIEMSAASGLTLLKPEERNPLNTTTFGAGELINAAVEMGAQRIILGIGGSATVDGGIGCAQATGHMIVLEGGEAVTPTEPLVGRDVSRVVLVKRHRGETTDGVEIVVACDVVNPLLGPLGAARVFAPQKGATPRQVIELEAALTQLATRLNKLDLAAMPGAGAAGGLGFGLLAYYGATLRPGIDIVIDAVNLRQRLHGADLCLTGEGRLDAQSLHGKTALGVARLCRSQRVPCIAVAGSVAPDLDAAAPQAIEEGLTAWFSIADGPRSLEEAMQKAAPLLARVTSNVMRLWNSRS